MKKNDIAVLILIVSISFLAAWLIGNAVLGQPKDKDNSIPVAEEIKSDIQDPDKSVFNAQAINPTIDRSIGKSAEKLPFSSGDSE